MSDQLPAGNRIMMLTESARIIAMFIASNEVWAIEMKDSKKVVGSIGLHLDDKRPKVNARMVGFVLHPAYLGSKHHRRSGH
jgi:[ribosomal protein S5]-alanine N-acetyltransferase